MSMRRDRAGHPGAGSMLRFAALGALLAGAAGCAPAPEAELVPRSTLIIGVDVSESFQNDGRYEDALAFAGHYIRAHLQGLGGLEQPRALFVGAIGGEKPGQPQAFHPIHDFEGKSPKQIEADLREWFPADDNYTDFTAFFHRAATLVQRQNLVLAPVTLVLFTDGIPDVGPGAAAIDEPARYEHIDLDALEYLARNITVRVLYPDPTVAVQWERSVPRDRVRMWTVDAVVMNGWRDQVVSPGAAERGPAPVRLAVADPDEDPAADYPPAGDPEEDEGEEMEGEAQGDGPAAAAEARAGILSPPREGDEQPDLWRWIRDNVDFRVRRSVL